MWKTTVCGIIVMKPFVSHSVPGNYTRHSNEVMINAHRLRLFFDIVRKTILKMNKKLNGFPILQCVSDTWEVRD
jgi:hypothetical protein